jgi:chromosomal replication initiation ATPase DnaA
MIADHLEPSGLAPDAEPIADFITDGNRKGDAVRGSKMLRNAILRLQRPPVRRLQYRAPLRNFVQRERDAGQIERIKRAVAEHFGLPLESLSAWRGRQPTVEKRQIAMFLAREIVRCSYPDIGRAFGGKDHSTVIHACQVVKSSPELLAEAEALKQVLTA